MKQEKQNRTNIAIILSVIVILLSFAIAFYLYPLFPEKMASHWGYRGEVNGYSSKFTGLFLMPIISIVMLIIFLLIPKLDPLKENIDEFRATYDKFILIMISFMFYVHCLTLLWNLGIYVNMLQFLAPAFCIIYFFAGVLMEKAKRNWSIGIRTPWTISSQTVWDKTHKIGSRLFKLSGILCLPGIIFPSQSFIFMIVPVLISSLYLVVYSYVEYRKENKNKK
jgi:uncharacterized membrane protein